MELEPGIVVVVAAATLAMMAGVSASANKCLGYPNEVRMELESLQGDATGQPLPSFVYANIDEQNPSHVLEVTQFPAAGDFWLRLQRVP